MERKCVLYDRECIECGECNLCDLAPSKVCDNCGKCIGLGSGEDAPTYRALKVDGIIDETMNAADYLYDEETPDQDEDMDGEEGFEDMFPFMRGNMR